MLLKLLTILLPWSLRRRALNRWFGYRIDHTARIGLSWIFPDELVMGPGARIGHFNVAIHLKRMEMGTASTIGRRNWITGFPLNGDSPHFAHQADRAPVLILGDHSAITKNHHIDCTHAVRIGKFTTIAGYYSQILTHSIDIIGGRQDSKPITIGDYCFIGTNVVILGGGAVPEYSVVGAKSLVNQAFDETYHLYGGVPAKPIKKLPNDAAYFNRSSGWVD